MNLVLIQLLLFLHFSSSQPFSLSQNLTEKSSWTYSVDISDDGFILVGGDYQKTYVYVRNEGNFSLHQTITESSSYTKLVDITGDRQVLLEVDR